MKKIELPPYKTYRVIATVKSVAGLKGEDTAGKGPCRYFVPGDKIVFDEGKIEGTICYSALASMMCKILSMRLGFDFPWAKSGVVEQACPDAARPVVFELRRTEGRQQQRK